MFVPNYIYIHTHTVCTYICNYICYLIYVYMVMYVICSILDTYTDVMASKVRINDLAAPPEKLDVLAYLERANLAFGGVGQLGLSRRSYQKLIHHSAAIFFDIFLRT